MGANLDKKGIDPDLEYKGTVKTLDGKTVEVLTLWQAYRQHLADYDVATAAEISGSPANLIEQLAIDLATIKPAAIHVGEGINHWCHATRHNRAGHLPLRLTGNIGKPGTGVNPLRGQNNVQGACDMGGLPNVYTAYQAVTNEAIQEKFQKAWGSTAHTRVGLTVTGMLDAVHHGNMKALWIMGENPMVSDPDLTHVQAALEECEFLVVQDIFPTETAALADVVLPGTTFAEKDGTFTGTDRRIQRIRKAIEPVGDSRPDWLIISQVAQRMQGSNGGDAPYAGWSYASPAEISQEVSALSPSYAGATYERLEELGHLQWPVPSTEHPGTAYLHKDKFSRGLGHFSPIAFKEPAEMPDAEYPLILTTGRMMFHYHTGSMTRRSEKLDREVPEGYVEMSPEDARRLGVNKSDKVRVISRRGEIETRAWITRRVPPGLLFIPFHFAEAAANVLTNPALDPVAKIPEYKVAAVRVETAA